MPTYYMQAKNTVHTYTVHTLTQCTQCARMHTHTSIQLHNAKQSLRQPCKTQLLSPSNQELGCLRHLSLVQANPPGAGQETHRRTVQVSQRGCGMCKRSPTHARKQHTYDTDISVTNMTHNTPGYS